MNGNTSCIHGLEEVILVKWPYYPKRSTDSMQSLSKPLSNPKWIPYKCRKNPKIHM